MSMPCKISNNICQLVQLFFINVVLSDHSIIYFTMTHVAIMYIKSMLYTPVGVGYWPEGVLSYLGMCCWSGCLFLVSSFGTGCPFCNFELPE